MERKTGKKSIEILAPAGGAEQLKAAVYCGADAVYFGMRDFNARRNASNFGDEDLAETIAFCHARGVRVHITLNTLILDAETDRMRAAADRACEAGADALIVQDLAVAEYLKKSWPDVELHASTQMAVHNAAGVRQLEDAGFDRAVLARELSLEEIKRILSETEMPCEVFVHGAHCMSVSGNCYLSAMIGGRSGNRGLCAQPCRLDWKKDDREYVLSLKDLSYISHIPELERSGVCSLKIEGRMKRAEYVAAAVTACREAREGGEPDLDVLRAVFSRSGFTDGYLTGKRNGDMFGIRTREDVTAAKGVLTELESLYRKETPRFYIDLSFTAEADKPASLTVSDGTFSASVTGDVPEAARTRELTEESALKNLAKTGGTPYEIKSSVLKIGEGIAMSPGQLNGMRREALERLTDSRIASFGHGKRDYHREEELPYVPGEKKLLRVRFERPEQIPDEVNADQVVLPLWRLKERPDLAGRFGDRLIAELPALIWNEAPVRTELERLRSLGLKHVISGNICAPELVRGLDLILHGGLELNVLNTVSLAEYEKLGFADLTLSFELDFRQIRALGSSVRRGILVYGRPPLMKFRNCPGRSVKGCGSCGGQPVLTDRMGEKFPVLCRDGQYSELLNVVPVYVADKNVPVTDFELLYFTVENREECERIIRMCGAGEKPDFRRTGGLYFRELL